MAFVTEFSQLLQTAPTTTGQPIGSGDWELHVERIAGNEDGAVWDLSEWSEAYVELPGTSGNYLSTPDKVGLDITADLSLAARIAPDDWTPSSAMTIVAKWLNTGNQRSYRLDLNTAGTLSLVWSTNGADNPTSTSTVSVSASDGEWLWVGVSLDVDDGAGGRDTMFWTSDDGVTWTQLGTTVHVASTTSIFASTSLGIIGGHTTGTLQPFAGKVSHASIYRGFDTGGIPGNTLRFRFDADVDLDGVESDAASFTTVEVGDVVTVNRSGTPDTELVVGEDDGWATLEWESINDVLRGMDWSRGAEAPNGRPNNGTITLTIENVDGANDPWQNYGNTRPGTIMRAGITSATDSRSDGWIPLWTGIVDSWPVSYVGARESGYRADSFTTVTLVETLAWLARIDENATAVVGSGDVMYGRIDRLLDAAEWPFGIISLSDPVGLPAVPLQSTDMNANRLAELYLTADSSYTAGATGGGGIVRSDVTGAALVTTRSTGRDTRLAEFSSSSGTAVVAFGAGDALSGDLWTIAYDADSVVTVNDPEPIINDHRYARVGGTQQVFEHDVSIGTFGRSTRARSDLIMVSDPYALAVAELDNVREALTALRVDAVSTVATGRPAVLLLVAVIDVGDNVEFTPPNGGDFTGVGNGVIRSMTHTITPLTSSGVHWSTSYAIDFSSFTNLTGAILPAA